MLSTIVKQDGMMVDWLNLADYGAIVAGGAALRWYQRQPVINADIDVFFQEHNGFLGMRKHIESLPSGSGTLDGLFNLSATKKPLMDQLRDLIYKPTDESAPVAKPTIGTRKNLCSSDRAETYEIYSDEDGPHKIQLIKTRYHEDINELVNSFDISVCQIATDGSRWYVGENFIQDLNDRRLRITQYNQHSLKRMIKYWAYGFTPDDETIQRVIDNSTTKWAYETSENEDYHDL